MSKFTETTAENLRALRTENGLKQEDIAEILGVEKYSISRIENGTRALSDSEKVILDWHFFGIAPAKVAAKFNLPSALEFTEPDWGIIGHLARREGVSEAQWIAGRIRAYLAYSSEKAQTPQSPKPHLAGNELRPQSQRESVRSFPEVPLIRAAAGSPILADAEFVEPDSDLGPGRFLLELRGDSMEPEFHDKQRIIMRDKTTLRRPVLKYGELYCFIHNGSATFKQWAKDSEGRKVLRSLNPEHPDILADDSLDWLGWFDKADNLKDVP